MLYHIKAGYSEDSRYDCSDIFVSKYSTTVPGSYSVRAQPLPSSLPSSFQSFILGTRLAFYRYHARYHMHFGRLALDVQTSVLLCQTVSIARDSPANNNKMDLHQTQLDTLSSPDILAPDSVTKKMPAYLPRTHPSERVRSKFKKRFSTLTQVEVR